MRPDAAPVALAPASGLRRLADAIERRLPLTPAEEKWLATAPWLSPAARRERRDGLLRELGALLGPASVNGRAAALAGELRHYAAVCWPLDRRRGPPPGCGARRGLLYEICSLDPDPPCSIRRLNAILAPRTRRVRPVRR